MKETTSKYGKRFDEEFQRDAVRMLESGERTIGRLSQELGVSIWSLKRWSNTLEKTNRGVAPPCRPWSLKTRSCGVNWRPSAGNETFYL